MPSIISRKNNTQGNTDQRHKTKQKKYLKQLELLYEGKGKTGFPSTERYPDKIHHFTTKDTATAFNNVKKATIENKGVLTMPSRR